MTGTTHLATVQPVQTSKGVDGVSVSALENSKVCRNRLLQASIPVYPCHATKPKAPDTARMLERSRERATWPCSRAFWRRLGVGFSVLLSLMYAPPGAEDVQ